MSRSWTTFIKKNSWNSLQNKPAILADNQISWGEIQNKPFNNSLTLENKSSRGISIYDSDLFGNSCIQFHRGKTGFSQANLLYVDWAWNDDKDYDVRLSMNNQYFWLDFQIGSPKLALIGLPSSASGLASGVVWRDASGYLRIV